MATYYNMFLKRFVHLDGSYYTQFDPIRFVEPGTCLRDPPLVIDHTCCPTTIRFMLERVRQEQV
jgi:hypothetical protein